MKVYGWDDTGPHRGDLLAANIAVFDLDFGLEMLAGDLGWECVFTSFKDARAALIKAMHELGVEEEIIKLTRRIAARHVPVVIE